MARRCGCLVVVSTCPPSTLHRFKCTTSQRQPRSCPRALASAATTRYVTPRLVAVRLCKFCGSPLAHAPWNSHPALPARPRRWPGHHVCGEPLPGLARRGGSVRGGWGPQRHGACGHPARGSGRCSSSVRVLDLAFVLPLVVAWNACGLSGCPPAAPTPLHSTPPPPPPTHTDPFTPAHPLAGFSFPVKDTSDLPDLPGLPLSFVAPVSIFTMSYRCACAFWGPAGAPSTAPYPTSLSPPPPRTWVVRPC